MNKFSDTTVHISHSKGMMSELTESARFLDLVNQLKPYSQRIVPDRMYCDIIFIRAFINESMKNDFPFIAREFINHECNNLPIYRDLTYGDDMPQCSNVFDFWNRTIVHSMYQGSKNGSEYCLLLMKKLFKTYYSKLYKSFKRFNSFSLSEILSLSEIENNKSQNINIISVILCMSQLYGIKLSDDCDVLYLIMEEKYKEQNRKINNEQYELPEGLFEASRKKVIDLFGDDQIEIVKQKFKFEKFTHNTLRYYGYPEGFVFYNMRLEQNIISELAKVLAILEQTYPSKEITKHDLLIYSNVFDAINAFVGSTDNVYHHIMNVFGFLKDTKGSDVRFVTDESILLNGKDEKKEGTIEENNIDKSDSDNVEYMYEDMLSELQSLRNKLHIAEQEYRNLRAEFLEVKGAKEELTAVYKENEDYRQELSALRSHLYRLTEYEDSTYTELDIRSMIEQLKEKKVTIIGGRVRWVQKMKDLFPSWKFISPNISVTNDARWISNSEYVYFYTDTLSHSVYNVFIQQVRAQQIPFGYIHGINMDINVKQLWDEIFCK